MIALVLCTHAHKMETGGHMLAFCANNLQASAVVQAEGTDHCQGTSSCKLQWQALQNSRGHV